MAGSANVPNVRTIGARKDGFKSGEGTRAGQGYRSEFGGHLKNDWVHGNPRVGRKFRGTSKATHLKPPRAEATAQ